MTTFSNMYREIMHIPKAVDQLLSLGKTEMQSIAADIVRLNPSFFISVARGSSDHAATYFKYISEIVLGTPVASVGPSIASIYGCKLQLSRSACLAISQSGKSPDIVELAKMASAQASLTVALTNHTDSDLSKVCSHTLDLHAGAELSVAATKTFVNSVVAAVWLVAEISQDAQLLKAIHSLPESLGKAIETDWSSLQHQLTLSDSLFCLGRGPAFAVANEAALKFKETCQLHAEAYSSAEVLHGPVSIIDRGFPVIALAGGDATETAIVEVCDTLAEKGAAVFITSDKAKASETLPFVRTAHPLTDPISLIVSFYTMVEKVACARGVNPDAPRYLKKVTETV